jgi:hypothetical protein
MACLASAGEWLAGEVKPPQRQTAKPLGRRPQVSWHRKCRRMPRSIRSPRRTLRHELTSVCPTEARLVHIGVAALVSSARWRTGTPGNLDNSSVSDERSAIGLEAGRCAGCYLRSGPRHREDAVDAPADQFM